MIGDLKEVRLIGGPLDGTSKRVYTNTVAFKIFKDGLYYLYEKGDGDVFEYKESKEEYIL